MNFLIEARFDPTKLTMTSKLNDQLSSENDQRHNDGRSVTLVINRCSPDHPDFGFDDPRGIRLATITSLSKEGYTPVDHYSLSKVAYKRKTILVLTNLAAEKLEAGHNNHGSSIPIDSSTKRSPSTNKNRKLCCTSVLVATKSILSAGTTIIFHSHPCLLRCCIWCFLQGTLLIFRAPCPARPGQGLYDHNDNPCGFLWILYISALIIFLFVAEPGYDSNILRLLLSGRIRVLYIANLYRH